MLGSNERVDEIDFQRQELEKLRAENEKLRGERDKLASYVALADILLDTNAKERDETLPQRAKALLEVVEKARAVNTRSMEANGSVSLLYPALDKALKALDGEA